MILGGVTDEALFVSEGDVGGSDSVTLVVGDDFDAAVFVDTDAGVGGSEVNTDDGADFGFFVVFLGADRAEGK